MTRLLLLIVAVAATAPRASAYVDLCWDAASSCVYATSWEVGAGSCDAGDPAFVAYRHARFTHTHDDTERRVDVWSTCSAVTADNSTRGTSTLRVAAEERDDDGRTTWLVVDWAGTDGTTASCSTVVTTHGLPAGDDGSTDHGCPAGRPPTAAPLWP